MTPQTYELPQTAGKSNLVDLVLLFSQQDRGEKEGALGRLAGNVSDLDVDYLEFVTLDTSFNAKLAAAENLGGTEITNWRFATELGAHLARMDALDAALPLLRKANRLLKRRVKRALDCA